jgi:cytoskeleton protein RodZ
MLNLSRQRETRQAAADVVTLEREPSTPLSVGEQLKLSRERFDLQIEEIADYLKIRHQYLSAIEEGRIEDLPGHAYAVGFVRAYAEYLGLDTGAIVERFKDETAEPDEQSRLVFPSPMPEGRTPGGALILIAVVGVALVYGAWIYLSAQDRSLAEIVPALPAAMQNLVGSETTPPAPESVKTANSELSVESTVTALAPKTRPASAAPATASPASVRKPIEPEAETQKIATQTIVPAIPDTLATSATVLKENVEAAVTKVATPLSTVAPVPSANETSTLVIDTVSEVAEQKIAAISPAEATDQVAPANESVSTATPSPSLDPVPHVDDLNIPASTLQGAEASTASAGAANILDTIDIPESVGTSSTGSQPEAVLPPSPPAESQSGPRQFGVENNKSRITIVALVDSWVEIRDGVGALLLTRLLKSGDSYLVPNQPGLKMHTGNAGGLRFEVDGQTAPSIGPKGAVRRDVALEPDALKNGASGG